MSVQSTIRLFKAVPIKYREVKPESSRKFLLSTLSKGFILTPEVFENYSPSELAILIKEISKELGLTGEQMNASFHKSWDKVANAPLRQLVIEQLFHYLTTYGFEDLGIYSKDSVYIPAERLEIPSLMGDLKLAVIHGYTKSELKEKLLSLLSTGIALKDETIKDVVDVALFIGLGENEINVIKNKETKVILYEYLNKMPRNPTEFLRFLVYKATTKSLLIKNKSTIEAIKKNQTLSIVKYFQEYEEAYGLEPLAKIFYRFKPIFLAFRTTKVMKIKINRIRRLAEQFHVPMPEDYLNSITAKLSRGEHILDSRLWQELAKVNTFRKIRLAYALNYRLNPNNDSILYKIRNGKSYATKFNSNSGEEVGIVLNSIMGSIIESVRKNVSGKTIYIPPNLVYALPATEKQFTGDLPSGTYVVVPKDMVFGIHWDNVGDNRIDLDLSLLNVYGKIGWDRSYRSSSSDILFSGDMTDASPPNGASELFYVVKQCSGTHIMMVNYYNYDKDIEVPYSILVSQEQAKFTRESYDYRGYGAKMHYMVDPNKVVCTAKSKIKQQQKILGIIVTSPFQNRFYFSESEIGKNITSYSDKDYIVQAQKYLFNFYTNAISLNKVLQDAGATLVADKSFAEIDLSPEVITRDAIIQLLK